MRSTRTKIDPYESEVIQMETKQYEVITTICPQCQKETGATGNGSHVVGNCDHCGHYFGGMTAEQADNVRRFLPMVAAPDKLMLTRGVTALDMIEMWSLLKAVKDFDAFGPDNDPAGVHDFGKIRRAGVDYFFKIDDYRGTGETLNGAELRFVLTVMRADEY